MARLASGIPLSEDARAQAKPASLVGPLIEATKPGITRLVTVTSTVGFILAASARTWKLSELLVIGLSCMAGTALSAAGALPVSLAPSVLRIETAAEAAAAIVVHSSWR